MISELLRMKRRTAPFAIAGSSVTILSAFFAPAAPSLLPRSGPARLVTAGGPGAPDSLVVWRGLRLVVGRHLMGRPPSMPGVARRPSHRCAAD